MSHHPSLPDALDVHFDDVGPFYDERGAATQMQVSTETLHAQVRAGEVLAMKTGSGDWVFPAWQFAHDHGGVDPGLLTVIRALKETDRWEAAVWLVADHPELGRSPRAALREGAAPNVVATLAREDAAAQRAR